MNGNLLSVPYPDRDTRESDAYRLRRYYERANVAEDIGLRLQRLLANTDTTHNTTIHPGEVKLLARAAARQAIAALSFREE